MEQNYEVLLPELQKEETSGSAHKNKRKKSIIDRMAIQLAVAVAIVAVAIAARFYFPNIYSSVTSHMSNSVDFVSAFNSIGKGISGESDMSTAIRDAYKYAFLGDGGNGIQVSAIE